MRLKNIFDGELVQDYNYKNDGSKLGNRVPFYLIFDALVVNGENVMHLNFRQRLAKSNDYASRTYEIYRMIREKNGGISDKKLAQLLRFPFLTIFMKDVFEVWDTPDLLNLIESK